MDDHDDNKPHGFHIFLAIDLGNLEIFLVGGDWNHGIFMTFHSVGNIIIPTE